jgi:hypothetical protein
MSRFKLSNSVNIQNLPERSKNIQKERSKIIQQNQSKQQTIGLSEDAFIEGTNKLDPYYVCPPTPPGTDSNDWYSSCIEELGIVENYIAMGLM